MFDLYECYITTFIIFVLKIASIKCDSYECTHPLVIAIYVMTYILTTVPVSIVRVVEGMGAEKLWSGWNVTMSPMLMLY